jgi:uroporphyrin-III C-methyltransferase/precorrin-2 dehydrogenase/sirohydrochlorin ferrochelatase
MEYLPIFLKSNDKKVIVVGGGVAAARKVDILLRSNCAVEVYANELGEELKELVTDNKIKHFKHQLTVNDCLGAIAAIGASADSDKNTSLVEIAKQANVVVNIVDTPDHCDFIMPATVDRSPVIISVSSSGTNPVLARLLRSKIETAIPASYGRLANFAARYRDRVKSTISDSKRRLRFWQILTDGPIAENVLAGKEEEARKLADDLIKDASHNELTKTRGEVYLVGAGPGDPDLLTFKALRLMQQADVVLYDRLLGDGILDMVRRDAERIYVGKQKNDHALPQEDISQLLVDLAKQGKRVLRLKGGDHFIFGRGGEEIEVLAEQGIDFQVVPGITAAHGCATYAGIPLTHRDHAQTCVFATGHFKDGQPNLNWKTLVQPNQTVAIYMGLSSLKQISNLLISNGTKADTPTAVIADGTRIGQRVITGTLSNIAELVLKENVQSPAMIVVGSVVTLREKLSWYKGEN